MNENRRVKDVVEYLQEVSKIKAKWSNSTLVFRGQENEEWLLDSSAERRLKVSLSSQNRIPDQVFIEYHEDLLNKCKLNNYDQREQKQLDDLELLADLQHHGAATCLIDFTRNALVALWFACKKSDKNGKVFVVNEADEKTFLEVADMDKGKPIRDILKFKARTETLLDQPSFWHWKPAHLNDRITAQHSLFIFGLPASEELKSEEIIVESASKRQILRELEELHDICEESLFPDFVGFAYTQRSNAPYPITNAEEYIRRGAEAGQRGQYSEAIEDFTKAIELKPDDTDAYFLRSHAYITQGRHNEAIQDLNKVIELKSDDTDAYFLRGHTYIIQGRHNEAIQDFNKALGLNPTDLRPRYARGLAWLALENWQNARSNLTTAKRMGFDLVGTLRFYAQSVADFEQKFEITLPEDIAAMLTESEN